MGMVRFLHLIWFLRQCGDSGRGGLENSPADDPNTGAELWFNLLVDGQEKTIEVNPSSHTYASIIPSNDGLDLPPNMLRR